MKFLFALLFPIISFSQDSLFLSTDKPAGIHEDIPQELGIVIRSQNPGQITHLKFYCVDAAKYTLTIWSITGSSLLSLPIQAKLGWNRLQLPIPFEVAAGDQYIVSYLTNQKFGYTKPMITRSVGNITQLETRYIYGHKVPTTFTTDGYFLDIVFKPQEVRKPLIVNTLSDSVYRLPKDSIIIISGIVSGDSVYYNWIVIDTVGTMTITGLNTLTPKIKTNEPCEVFMSLNGFDKWGNSLIAGIDFFVLPDPKSVRIELYMDGTYKIIR